MEDPAVVGLFVVLILFVLLWYIGLLVVVGIRAHNLGRDAAFWVIIAILTSPIITLPLLHCAGETKEHRLRRIEDEEYFRARARIKASGIYRDDERDQRKMTSDQYRNHERYMPK